MSKPGQFSRYGILLRGFHGMLENLEHLNGTLPTLYSSYNESELQKIRRNHNLSEEEDEILIEIIKSAKKNEWAIAQEKMTQLSNTTLEFFIEYIQNVAYKRNIESFVKEMSIVFLITTFEEFLKNVLKEVFLTKNEVLKSAKTITYEEIINLNSYDAIIEKITEKKAEDIIDNDISEIGKILLDNYGCPIINDDKWDIFTEVYYRRHVLVHNNGKPDDKYRSKTGLDVYSSLTPTEDYIKQTITLFKSFSTKIESFFSSKYPSMTDQIIPSPKPTEDESVPTFDT